MPFLHCDPSLDSAGHGLQGLCQVCGEMEGRRNKFVEARVNSDVELNRHFLCGFPMLSQFSVFPPLSESPLEVSDVRPNSQSFSIDLECRVVLR
jgi:hypothetical protein